MVGWTLAVGLFVAGYLLARRRGYFFCLVMAGIACTFSPFGTVLGVFTLLVLLRSSVKQLFGRTGGDGPGQELAIDPAMASDE